jgi:hypothetical protein
MPRNADNIAHYSNAALLDLIATWEGTRQQWVATAARAELRRRAA